jgi:hypothetical protein
MGLQLHPFLSNTDGEYGTGMGPAPSSTMPRDGIGPGPVPINSESVQDGTMSAEFHPYP